MQPISSQDGIQAATAIFRSLVGDRVTDKYKAVELLNDRQRIVDFPTLRALLLQAVNNDFSVGKEDERADQTIARTRSWLLATLARVSAGDQDATDLVVKHVHKKLEPYDWARYWSLEGLISGKNPAAQAVAREVAHLDHDPMVSMLATAFLALSDPKEARRIKVCLEDPDTQWFVLRALRVIPLEVTVSTICTIVKGGDYTDVTYDAIMALGRIPSDWRTHASTAAQALAASIAGMRGSPWKDGMRTGAITGLGNLKIESHGPLIVEELVDDNPAVVREAARAIEKILGLNVTVVRVVEAASKGDAAGIDAYARALRWLNRDAVAEELETLMITGAARQQDMARTLLSELGGAVAFEKLRARTDAMKQYTELLEKTEEGVRRLFEASVLEAQKGFHLAVIMDIVVFGIGVLLLLGSAAYALFGTGDLSKWAVGLSGGTGVLGIIYGVLIANPRRQVRESVDHLMRLKIVFLAYLRRLHQTDQAYTRRLLDDEPLTVDQLKSFADIVGGIMKDTIQQQLECGTIKGSAPVPPQT